MAKNIMKLILLKIFILSIFHPYLFADALRCYVCRPDGSENDQQLRDVFNAINQQREGSSNSQYHMQTCSSYRDEKDIPMQQCRSETLETRCVKFARLKSGSRGDYEFEDEDHFSGRGCANIAKPYTSFVATEGWARHEQYNMITLHYCDEDGCNSSGELRAGVILLVGAILILVGNRYRL